MVGSFIQKGIIDLLFVFIYNILLKNILLKNILFKSIAKMQNAKYNKIYI